MGINSNINTGIITPSVGLDKTPIKLRTIYFGISNLPGNNGFGKVAYVLTEPSSLAPTANLYEEIDSLKIIGSGSGSFKLWFYPTDIWSHYYCVHFNETNPYSVDISAGTSDVTLYARTILNEYQDGCIGKYFYFSGNNLPTEVKDEWEIKWYTDKDCTDKITENNQVQYVKPSITITGGKVIYYTITHKKFPELYVKKVYKTTLTDDNLVLIDLYKNDGSPTDGLYNNLFEFKSTPTLPECKVKFIDKDGIETGVKGINFIDKNGQEHKELKDIVFEEKDN